MKDLAFVPERRYYHREVGFNYRMTNIQAAIGVAQMAHVAESVASRRRNAQLYHEKLKAVRGLRLPIEPPDRQPVFWYYSIVVEDDFGVSRDELMEHLARHGIESRSFFFPVHRQPIYPELEGENCPVAEFLGERGLSLPSGNTLTEEDINVVAECVGGAGRG